MCIVQLTINDLTIPVFLLHAETNHAQTCNTTKKQHTSIIIYMYM